ncbi:hypothetical protein TthSNM11_02990 [Thermus thermophilus]|nr:hypothetical protein TthSNM11_02990 [Thermus thermophilus]
MVPHHRLLADPLQGWHEEEYIPRYNGTMPQQSPVYPVPTRIYHITHLENLEGILVSCETTSSKPRWKPWSTG